MKILAERGEKALTLDSVARLAGVSKAGLPHHFPSRNALLEGLYLELMGRRFCRGYLQAITSLSPDDAVESASLLNLLIQKDLDLKTRLSQWTIDRLEEHAATDSFPEAHLGRYAADGRLP